MTDRLVVPVVDDGLGTSAYLVDLGGGRALAVDASLDLRALDAAADRHGATTAASMLERARRSDVAVLSVGPQEWAKATGSSVEMSA